MARPTSRWALAKRVTESIISRTSWPLSRKCSAIEVAVSAALMRTSAGWSEVATMTTECPIASPRSRSMNSRTSRPRSPTRQMTLMSAVVERAIMPSSDDLPTPEPAKMPRRWPRPQGTMPSRTRTPRPTRSRMRGRSRASGGAPAAERTRPSGRSSPWSIGRPRPSSTRPSSSSPTGTRTGSPVAVTTLPGPMPCSSPSGMSSVRRERKPTTSAGTGARPRPVAISHTSPTSASRPVASTISPMRSDTRPWRRCRSARATAAPRRFSRDSAIRELVLEHLASAGEVGLERRVDLALARAHDGAARAHAALGLHLAVLDAAQLAHEPRDVVADELEVVGIHEDEHAVALDQAAQSAAHGLDDELGVDRDGGAHGLLGDPQREIDRVGLHGGGGVGAQRLKLISRGGQGGGGAVELALRLRDAGGEALLEGLLAHGVDGRGAAGRGALGDDDGLQRGQLEGTVGAHTTSSSSSAPRRMTSAPASSRRRTAATTLPWASSTTAFFCGSEFSMSSRSISAPRWDMLLRIFSTTGWSTPRRASWSSF